MQYTPKLTKKDIEENHRHFSRRAALYKKRGLDFLKIREFIFKKVYPLQGSILEIGTGTGYATLVLAKAGYKFTSIDTDKESLEIAALNLAYENALSNVAFYVMDGKSLDFENKSFRNIVVINLFHHIDDIDKVLSEIDRVLCRGGKAVLADFNKNGLKIVGSVHKQEGRIHEDVGVSKKHIYSYFHRLGYDVKSAEDKHHWVLIAKKKI